jgi:hypothetical protein
MAAKRKKSRGLSGSSEHHEAVFARNARLARLDYQRADEAMNSGASCKTVWSHLVDAFGGESIARTHYFETDKGRRQTSGEVPGLEFKDDYWRVSQRFAERCLLAKPKKKGALAGLRKRRK